MAGTLISSTLWNSFRSWSSLITRYWFLNLMGKLTKLRLISLIVRKDSWDSSIQHLEFSPRLRYPSLFIKLTWSLKILRILKTGRLVLRSATHLPNSSELATLHPHIESEIKSWNKTDTTWSRLILIASLILTLRVILNSLRLSSNLFYHNLIHDSRGFGVLGD